MTDYKLFKVSIENFTYDDYDSMIVSSRDIVEARSTCCQFVCTDCDGYNKHQEDEFRYNSEVLLIGTSISKKREVILASFNAG